MSARFSKFDRGILGAVFVGILLVGIGVIVALQTINESLIATRDVAQKADRNFNATTSEGEAKRIADQKRGNATIGLFLPLLLDLDEDTEQLKKFHNISRGQADDLLVIDYNGSYLKIGNETTIMVPNFRELLGVQNRSGNADVLGTAVMPFVTQRNASNEERLLNNVSSQSSP